MIHTLLFEKFFKSERTGGYLLIGATIVSLLVANSSWGATYRAFWHSYVGGLSIEHWVNDALMAIFFLLIGLEIEREIYVGELSNLRQALMPIFAAIGGVALPAMIHFSLNVGTATQKGIGIPMATDIAFSLGVLSLFGKRVPLALKVFLTALAICDDLIAILVIAFFYSKGINFFYLGAAAGVYALAWLINFLRIKVLWPYLILFVGLWYCFLHSGIHATIAGVLMAFAIPFSKKDETAASDILMHYLHKPVAFFILPVFALVNTGIVIPAGWASSLFSMNGLGIILGLLLGKPIGILLMTFLGERLGLYALKDFSFKYSYVICAGILAAIGFTMSIFITLLAFEDPQTVVESKIAVFLASLLAGLLGYIVLNRTLPRESQA